MRNGSSAGDPAEDRGSAILSTLPLSEPIAIELPGERQRRVVIIAQVGSIVGRGRSPRRARGDTAFAGLLDSVDARRAGARDGAALPERSARRRRRPEHVARTRRAGRTLSRTTVSSDAALSIAGARTPRSRLHVLSRGPASARALPAGRNADTDRTIGRSSAGLSESELEDWIRFADFRSDRASRVAVLAKPSARILIAGAGVRDEAPEVARVIEPPQMHQLMDQNVVADDIRHQHKTPVEADVTRRRAGSPPRSLIAYADARHLKTMMLASRSSCAGSSRAACRRSSLRASGVYGRRCAGLSGDARPLALNPGPLLLGKELGVAAGSPSRNGDTDASVGRTRMTYRLALGWRMNSMKQSL